MAAKTYYLKDVAVNLFGSLQDGGTGPSTVTLATGWKPAKTSATQYAWEVYGSSVAAAKFSATVAPDTTGAINPDGFTAGWRSENAITGSFANANWSFTFSMISQGAAVGTGAITFRLWKGIDNTGATGLTEITSGVQTTSTVNPTTSTAQSATLTFNPGAITFTGEYLFVVCAWKITVAGSSNSSEVRFRTDSTNSKITTASFTASLPCSTNYYTLAGRSVTLAVAMPADTGAFTQTGKSTTLAVTLPVSNASFTLSGQAATLTTTHIDWTGRFDTDAGHYTTSGSQVTQWTDQSGNARHLAPGSGNGPLIGVTTTPSGHTALDFNGSSHELHSTAAMSTFITNSAYTFYMVVRIDAAARNAATYYDNNALWMDVQGALMDYGYSGLMAKNNTSVLLGNYDGAADEVSSSYTTSNWMVIEGRHESGTLYLRINNGSETSIASGNTTSVADVLYVFFNAYQFNNYYTDGAVACIEFSNTAVGSSLRTAERTRLLNKYILTLACSTGTYTHTGQATTLAVKMPAAQGSFTLSGQAATLTYTVPTISWVSKFVNTSYTQSSHVVTSWTNGGTGGDSLDQFDSSAGPIDNTRLTQTGQVAFEFVRANSDDLHQTVNSASHFGFGSAWCAFIVLCVDNVTQNTSTGSNDAIFCDSGNTLGLEVKGTNTLQAYQFSALLSYDTVTDSIDLGRFAVVEVSCTGLQLAMRINNHTEVTVATLAAASSGVVDFFTNAGNHRADGAVALFEVTNSVPSSTLRDAERAALIAAYTVEKIVAGQGSFTHTGQSTTLAVTLPVSNGNYTETGQSTTLSKQSKISASNGSITLSGQSVVLAVKLPVAFTTYAETGQSATFTKQSKITAAVGTIVESGQAVTLAVAIPASFGTFAETGQTAGLSKQSKLTATFGSFAETGQTVNFTFTRQITAAIGSFTESGQSVVLAVSIPAAFGSFTETGQIAGLSKQSKISLINGAFTESGQAVVLNVTIPVSNGSFSETGQIALLTKQSKLSCAFGTFTETGFDTNLSVLRSVSVVNGSISLTGESVTFGVTIPVDNGSFAYTGEAAQLVATRIFATQNGSIALSGQNVVLDTSISAGEGSFTLTGNAATLVSTRLLQLANGTFVETGEPATLLAAHFLSADPGSITLTGQSATFDDTIPAEVGQFDLTGEDADFDFTRTIVDDFGAFALNGRSANFIYTQPGSFVIVPDTGLFALSGESVSFADTMTGDVGLFSMSGQDANLLVGRKTAALHGSFALTGNDVGLAAQRKLVIDSCSYALSGEAVSLLKTTIFGTYTGNFTLSGNTASFVTDRKIDASFDSIVLTGEDANLIFSAFAPTVEIDTGSFSLAGSAANLVTSARLAMGLELFALTGKAITLTLQTPYNPDPTSIMNVVPNGSKLFEDRRNSSILSPVKED